MRVIRQKEIRQASGAFRMHEGDARCGYSKTERNKDRKKGKINDLEDLYMNWILRL
jgi:hypothetical protein